MYGQDILPILMSVSQSGQLNVLWRQTFVLNAWRLSMGMFNELINVIELYVKLYEWLIRRFSIKSVGWATRLPMLNKRQVVIGE
jgi:hypothetical protein